MNRSIVSLCVAGVGSLALLAPGTAYAAETGAEASANALSVTLLGQSGDTGTVVATNDTTGEQKRGDRFPVLGVLGGQDLVGAGVLVQDAVAADDGTSAACAGVTGDELSVIAVGQSERCITEGGDIAVDLAEIDLVALLDVELATGTGPLSDLLGPLADTLLAPVLGAVQEGLNTFTTSGLTGSLDLEVGALESTCTFGDGQTAGTTYLTDLGLDLQIRDTVVPLLSGDVDPQPDPDTPAVAQLGDVVALVIDELESSLAAELAAVVGLTEPLQAAVLNAVMEPVGDQVLAQLQENLVDITLNRQLEGEDSIEVTGLDAVVLPKAAEPLLDLQLANVACGPFDAAPAGAGGGGSSSGGATPVTDTAGNPVPTVVNAGAEPSTDHTRLGAFLGTLAAMLGLGAVARARRAVRA